MNRLTRPLCLVAAALGAAGLVASCTTPAPPSAGSPNGPGAPDAGNAGASSGPDPEPTGRPLVRTAEFDEEPCAAASVTEIRDALAGPFDTIAGDTLVPQHPPVVLTGDDAGPGGSAGCEYQFVAEGTDSAEAYHMITVTVVRLAQGGPELMSACEDAAQAEPMTYRVLDLADGACVGAGAVLGLLVGDNHYSVTAKAIPGRADQTDEDLRLGMLAEAAGTVLADRLPGA